MVEMFTQNAYFVFQIVQVFLVTTLTSAASAAFEQIIENPLSAKDLLSQNLPKASNFYLSYILVQCLAGGAGNLLHLLELIRHEAWARSIDNPRLRFRTWYKLRVKHWGSVYPVFTTMGVIGTHLTHLLTAPSTNIKTVAICYTCIAPLILAFAGLGMCCTYLVYKYNLIYSFDSELDTKGLLYPQALMHLLVGLYLAEICLIGLFALQSAFAPLLLMILFLIFTALVHISLNDAFNPLLTNLPRTLALEDEDLAGEDNLPEDAEPTPNSDVPQGGLAADYYNMEEGLGEEVDEEPLDSETTARGIGIEGAGTFTYSIQQFATTYIKNKINAEVEDFPVPGFLVRLYEWTLPDRNKEPNLLMRWLHPGMFDNFRTLREQLTPETSPPIEYSDDYSRKSYWQPEMWVPPPQLWIPQDEARVSRQEVVHTRDVISITDRGAWIDAKGRVDADLGMAPLREPMILY
jgi:calcium permeable stress-gated cation channel